MKKRKHVMKVLTMVLAATLMMSMSMTAFAANCCTVENDETVCKHDADDCDMIDCPVHETKTRTVDTEDTDDDTNAESTDNKTDADKKTDDADKKTDDEQTAEDEEEETPQGCVCENDDCNCTECNMECDDCETCKDCSKGCAEQIKKAKAEAEKNNDDDVDSAKAGEEEDADAEDDTAGMSADIVKDETETVKTGEFNMIPIIIGLAVVAIGAGGAYVVYRKKRA